MFTLLAAGTSTRANIHLPEDILVLSGIKGFAGKSSGARHGADSCLWVVFIQLMGEIRGDQEWLCCGFGGCGWLCAWFWSWGKAPGLQFWFLCFSLVQRLILELSLEHPSGASPRLSLPGVGTVPSVLGVDGKVALPPWDFP